jgi:hypothetical protein
MATTLPVLSRITPSDVSIMSGCVNVTALAMCAEMHTATTTTEAEKVKAFMMLPSGGMKTALFVTGYSFIVMREHRYRDRSPLISDL